MTVQNNELLWAKVRPDSIIPTKRDEDAGYDIYPCFEEDLIVIPSHETKMISTGIASAFSENYVMILKERGSTGTKGIAQRCGVLDSGFRNEWFVPITNTSSKTLIISKITEEDIVDKYLPNKSDNDFRVFDEANSAYLYFISIKDKTILENTIIYPYSKAICQALLLPVPKVSTKEITYDELKSIESNRGAGMLGSSGK